MTDAPEWVTVWTEWADDGPCVCVYAEGWDFVSRIPATKYARADLHAAAETRAEKTEAALEAVETQLARLLALVQAEQEARQLYELLPTDRGGKHGPKGQARAQWGAARIAVASFVQSLKAEAAP